MTLLASQQPRALATTVTVPGTVARQYGENGACETRGIVLLIADQRQREVDGLDLAADHTVTNNTLTRVPQRGVKHVAVASAHHHSIAILPKSARQVFGVCETEERHRLQTLQRALGQTAHQPHRSFLPTKLTVRVNELAVRAEDRHRHGGLEEEHVVVDLLRGDDLIHLVESLGGLLLRYPHLLLEVRDLRLEVADKLDRFEQNVDLALADHRAGGLQSTPHSDDYDNNGVQFINLGVQTLHSASFRCVVY